MANEGFTCCVCGAQSSNGTYTSDSKYLCKKCMLFTHTLEDKYLLELKEKKEGFINEHPSDFFIEELSHCVENDSEIVPMLFNLKTGKVMIHDFGAKKIHYVTFPEFSRLNEDTIKRENGKPIKRLSFMAGSLTLTFNDGNQSGILAYSKTRNLLKNIPQFTDSTGDFYHCGVCGRPISDTKAKTSDGARLCSQCRVCLNTLKDEYANDFKNDPEKFITSHDLDFYKEEFKNIERSDNSGEFCFCINKDTGKGAMRYQEKQVIDFPVEMITDYKIKKSLDANRNINRNLTVTFTNDNGNFRFIMDGTHPYYDPTIPGMIRKLPQFKETKCFCCGENIASEKYVPERTSDGFALCSRCDKELITVSDAFINDRKSFYASHTSDELFAALAETYTPKDNITFNYKTQKIHLRDKLSAKKYRVISFNDIVNFSYSNGTDKESWLSLKYMYNGKDDSYLVTGKRERNVEFAQTEECIFKIPDLKFNHASFGTFEDRQKAATRNLTTPAVVPSNAGMGTNNNTEPRIKCPACGSTALHPVTETSSSGKNYDLCRGLCCYGPLGPLGLLCGIDKGVKTTSDTYWMCQNCGHKFRG